MLTRVWPSRPAFETRFSDLDSLRREMLRLLEGQPSVEVGERGAGVFPPINVTQDDDNYYVRAEVPGIRASDLSISTVNSRISIAGKREIPNENGRVSYHRKERAEGSFNRTLTLPTEFDAERVEARSVDGILTLTLPKAENAKPRQIVVKG